MKRILFQGDSITDTNRDRKVFEDLGKGYPAMVASKHGLLFPGQFEYVNRGISGDRLADVCARLQEDIIDLKPDYLSLLVGVNDVWHGLANYRGYELQPSSMFAYDYTHLLETVGRKLPCTKVILMEPFVLPGTRTNDYFARFAKELRERAEIVCRLAEEYDCTFIPLQKDVQELTQQAPEAYWLADGVHPTCYFHQYIADRWMEIFNSQVISNNGQ